MTREGRSRAAPAPALHEPSRENSRTPRGYQPIGTALESAEAGFREVQEALLNRQLGYDAALVSLDLALLYASEGRTAALKRLASEMIPAFESREVHREAMAALLMFQGACEEERVTIQLARQLADFLQRERRPAPFPSHS